MRWSLGSYDICFKNRYAAQQLSPTKPPLTRSPDPYQPTSAWAKSYRRTASPTLRTAGPSNPHSPNAFASSPKAPFLLPHHTQQRQYYHPLQIPQIPTFSPTRTRPSQPPALTASPTLPPTPPDTTHGFTSSPKAKSVSTRRIKCAT